MALVVGNRKREVRMTVSSIHLAKLKGQRLLELQLLGQADQAVSQMTKIVSELLDKIDIQFKETVAGWDSRSRYEDGKLREMDKE